MTRPSYLSRNVLALGLVSLLTDTATDMVIPLLPIFLTVTLGAGATALGWIEGLAELTASVLKLVSGRIADRTGRNRPLVIGGYSLSSVVRPFIAAATVTGHVLAVRILDRVGKGLRSSPRDALIAASVAPAERGRAFGLHRAMDHAGAVLGPLLAAGFLASQGPDLRTLFWLSAIPGALAVMVLVLATREQVSPPSEPAEASARPSSDLVRVLVPVGIFSLGNATDVFLLLKANATDAPIETLPLLWMGLHIVKSISAVLGGRLADAWGRRRTIGLGWLFYAGIYTAFAFVESPLAVAVLFRA